MKTILVRRYRRFHDLPEFTRPGLLLCVLTLAGVTANATTEIAFDPPVQYGVGNFPVAVAIGDLNADDLRMSS